VLLKLFFLAYHYHSTKHVRLPPSQYKTCTPTTITVQNMYSYHHHSTKHVLVPLSQYKTCSRTTITVQNMYSYHHHSTKNVLVPLSQYKAFTLTTIKVRNMYVYHRRSTKHVTVRIPSLVRVPLFEKHCSAAFKPSMGPTKPPIQLPPGTVSLVIKRPEREGGHSRLLALFKNM
jgi:hypothetical protein